MLHLVDSDALLRLSHRRDPSHSVVLRALRTLRQRSEELCVTPQNLAEFWNVTTRQVSARGGYGLSVSEADRRVRLLERRFTLLTDDSLAVYREWRHLIVAHSVSGVKVYDARLVAAMHVHGITHLVTLNVSDFTRYTTITPLHPGDIK